MSELTRAIVDELKRAPEGGLVVPKHFLHLASRAAIDQALGRLAKSGQVVRIARGIYCAPITSKYGHYLPEAEHVIAHLQALTGDTIVSHPARAANDFGLTAQVPVREIYLTSGAFKRLELGSQTVDLHRGKPWQFLWGNSPAGHAVRALGWGVPEGIAERVSVVRQMIDRTEWQKVFQARAKLPGWMAKEIGRQGKYDSVVVGAH